VVVFGLGGIGLNVVQGARLAGAEMIVGVDLNPGRKALAEKFGMTHFVNPKEVEGDLVPYLVNLTKGGADYSFECIGNVKLMRQALECCHKGWGVSIIIGVAGAGQEITTRPFQLVTGRVWKGSAFGGARGRTDVPKIVDWYMDGKINIDDLITHNAAGAHQRGLRPDARGQVDPLGGSPSSRRTPARAATTCPTRAASYDFGKGAGFYVDATQEPWRKHYRMYSYLTEELPWLVAANFPVDPTRSASSAIRWAATARWCWRCATRSASSRCRPSRRSPRRCAAPGARRRFAGYLGEDRDAWRQYDATALIESRGWKGRPAGRPGHGRPVSRYPAQAGTAARGLPSGRRGARPAPARGLRPQLFLHRQLHRGAPRFHARTWPRCRSTC
jgi:hypothetical protein